MDIKERLYRDTWAKSTSSDEEIMRKVSPENSSFTNFNLRQHQQKWEDTSMLDYGIRIEPPVREFSPLPGIHSARSPNLNTSNQIKMQGQKDGLISQTFPVNKIQDWDPTAMLNDLTFLEQKIHQLQDLLNSLVDWRDQPLGQPDELVAQQQQLINVELTSVIVQLISTAGNLLPSVRHFSSTSISPIGQLGGIPFPSGAIRNSGGQQQVLQQGSGSNASDQSNLMDASGNGETEPNYSMEEHELKDEEDADEGENLPPGSYEILQLEKEEILAPHTHFCTICGKGFKRDANLRMHMRGHGDEYKTPAALAKPRKESGSEPVLIKRYSCPFAGCKRNKDHKKFQPLKTILCVKNHYKRTHCDKRYTCGRCNTKKFSVIADLKTHEKHCGTDKWLCSCGTTFSRKDKLFGHIALFQGHTPAILPDDTKGRAALSDKGDEKNAGNKVGSLTFSFGSNATNGSKAEDIIDRKGRDVDPATYSLPFNFDAFNCGGFHEFPQPPFDNSESSFSFLISGSCDYNQKNGGDFGSNNLH